MKSLSRILVVLTAVLLVTIPLLAQGTTGRLTGNVTMDGAPMPGVTVTVTSPALQGTRTAYTDVNGNYSIGALPPGMYSVAFEMESMQTVTRQVNVALAQQVRADAQLRLSAMAEAITVTASAPAVLETQEVATNIQADLVESLPLGRDLNSTISIAPGVTQNGPNSGIVISGGYSYDNLFLINGAVTNENVRGQSHNLFIEDAIQETTVMTGAVSAEYGRFTGGVVSAITKSGGNEFSGSLRDSLTNPSWNETTPRDEPLVDSLNEVYEGTLGGRIIRDRLWFFGAGRYYETTTPQFLRGTTVPVDFGDEQTRLEGKLTGNITDRHTAVISYLDVTQDQSNYCFSSCLEMSNIDTGRSLPNDFRTLQYNGVLTNNLLIEAGYSEKFFTFEGSGGDFRDRIAGTAGYDGVDTGAFFGAPVFCGVCDPETRDNESLFIKGTYYLSTANFGTHNLVAGFEDFSESRLSNNYQSGSDFFVSVYGISPIIDPDGTFHPVITAGDVIEYWPVLQASLGSELTTQSVFINNRWDLNPRLSFNLGARYDVNDAVDSAGNTIGDDSEISPRLGAIWDINSDGRYRVNVSYSKYVSKIAETVGGSASAAGRPAYFAYEYDGPTINEDGSLSTQEAFAELFSWFDSRGGLDGDTLVFASVPGVNRQFRGSLRSPSADEIQIGFGTQIGSRGHVRADYINREWNNFYTTTVNQASGQVTDSLGRVFDLGFVENSNGLVREYDAVQLQSGYRLLDRLNVGLNYTWSETVGNVTGETAGSGPVTDTVDYYNEFSGFAQNNPVGYLADDQRHRVRAWIAYDLPTPVGNFNVSLLQRFDSGTSYSAIGTLARSSYAGTDSLGYRQAPSTFNYYFGERGSFRWDDVTATDVALNYSLPVFGVGLFIQGEVINAFNEDAQIGGNTTVFTNFNAACVQGSGGRCAAFNPFTDTPQEGVNYQFGPSFGEPTSTLHYQTPRTYRVSAGLRF